MRQVSHVFRLDNSAGDPPPDTSLSEALKCLRRKVRGV